MKHLLVFAFFLFLLGTSQSALAKPFTCEIHSKFHCNGEACQPVAAVVWNLIDLENSTLSRCDEKGCDHYQMKIHESGLYLILDIADHGLLAKMARDGSSFVEIATHMTDSYVSHGKCDLGKGE